MPPGQERLLSFGVDQQVRVDAKSGQSESSVIAGRIVKGVLQLTYKNVSSTDYAAENKGQKDKTLLIEHARRQGWKLVGTADPVETTEQLYRFKGQSPAGKQTKLTVKEELVRAEAIAILPADPGQLEVYARTGPVPAAVKEALAKAVALKRTLAETERQVQEWQQRIKAITDEQDRMRENIQAVQPNTEYYNRIVKKLNEQETEIEDLRDAIDELHEKRDTQRRDLENYLANLNVA